MKDIRKHIVYYTSLVLILSLGTLFFFQTYYDKQMQLNILLLMACFYFVYGLVHHYANHDLSIKIVVEYLLIGAIGVSIILFFL